MFKTLLTLLSLLATCCGLDNGLGINPLFGWTTGDRYNCLTDCTSYPEDCISEHLIRTMADMLTLSSFARSGYRYLVVGDCWMDHQRDPKGRLRADIHRFPSGMPALVSYLHKKKLKLGLHVDLGNSTCGGFPGSQGRYDLDAQTLADWGVDMVTAGACGIYEYTDINKAYPEFGISLNRTNVPIIYDCDWPVILDKKGGGRADFQKVSDTCNYFRVVPKTVRSTESLTKVLTDYAGFSYIFKDLIGPGSYIDFNQLTLGGSILSIEQETFQVAFWAIIKSPMLVSSDLTALRGASKRLLLNPELISLTNDDLGSVATRKLKMDMISLWTKEIRPEGSWMLAIFNTNIVGLPSQTSFQLNTVGVTGAGRYNVTEVFTGDYYGVFKPWNYFNCQVEPSSALLFKFIAI